MTKTHKKTKGILIATICLLMLLLTTITCFVGCSLDDDKKDEPPTLTVEQQAKQLMDGATANLLSLDNFKVKEIYESGDGEHVTYYKKSFNNLSWYSQGDWHKVEKINNKNYIMEYYLDNTKNVKKPVSPYIDYALFDYVMYFMNYDYFMDSMSRWGYIFKVSLVENEGVSTIIMDRYHSTDPTVKIGCYSFLYKKIEQAGNEYALFKMESAEANDLDVIEYEYDFADGLMPSTDLYTWVDNTPTEIVSVYLRNKEDQPIVIEKNTELRNIDIYAKVKNSAGDEFEMQLYVEYPEDYMVTAIYNIEGFDVSSVHYGKMYIHIMDLPAFVVNYSVVAPAA